MTPESLRAYVEYGLRDRGDGVLELKCRPEVESRVYAMAPGNGAWAELPTMSRRSLVACGEVSTDIGPAARRRIAERLPHGQLEVWPGLRPLRPAAGPRPVRRVVLRFADS